MRRLGIAAAAAWIVAPLLTGATVFLFDWQGSGSAWLIATGVGLLAVLATLPVLLIVAGQTRDASTDQLIRLWAGVLGASAARVVITALGIILPVKLFDAATWPTFTFVAAHYVLLTLAEVGVLARMFWQRDVLTTDPASPTPGSGP